MAASIESNYVWVAWNTESRVWSADGVERRLTNVEDGFHSFRAETRERFDRYGRTKEQP